MNTGTLVLRDAVVVIAVEMPMTDEEVANKTPATKLARAIYILFCGGLFLYGLVANFR